QSRSVVPCSVPPCFVGVPPRTISHTTHSLAHFAIRLENCQSRGKVIAWLLDCFGCSHSPYYFLGDTTFNSLSLHLFANGRFFFADEGAKTRRDVPFNRICLFIS